MSTLPRLRSLTALLLIVPVQAQVLHTKAVLPVSLAAPAAVFAAPAIPALLTPSAISPQAAAPMFAPLRATPVLAAAPARASNLRPTAIKSSRDIHALEQPATPAEGWASRFNFELGRKVFDGELTLKDNTGAVFVAVPKPDGKVRLHIVERAPLAAVRPVEGTEGRFGAALLDTVASIAASGHRVHTYSDASLALFSKADNVVIEGVQGVVDAYSGIFVPGTSGHGADYPEPGDTNDDGHRDRAGMNVEHTWPQSLFNRALPMRSDLHHLMATFEHPNSVRGSLPFGVVTSKPDYENKAGAKRGFNAQGKTVFEPPNAVKGRVARDLLYFYARYKDSRLFGRNSALFWNQQIEVLLRWNREYPSDTFEAGRNDFLQTYQGNRNPFVDDPGLADRIGADAFRAGNQTHGRPSLRGQAPMNLKFARPVERKPTIRWGPFFASIGPMTVAANGEPDVLVDIFYQGKRYLDPMTLTAAASKNGEQTALREFRAKLDSAVNFYRQSVNERNRAAAAAHAAPK